MIRLIYPTLADASEVIDGEPWAVGDGSEVVIHGHSNISGGPKDRTKVLLDFPGLLPGSDTSQLPPAHGRLSLHFKVDTSSLTETIKIALQANSLVNSPLKSVDIAKSDFDKVGLSGVVAVSLVSVPGQNQDNNGLTGTLGAAGSDGGLFFNGHRVATRLSTISVVNAAYRRAGILFPAGTRYSSIFICEDNDAKKRRWWSTRVLNAVSQVGGEVTVDPEDFDTGFSSDKAYAVEMATDFERKPGSTILAASQEIFARHRRNSVKFGTASINSKFGNAGSVVGRANATAADGLTLLDVGVETMRRLVRVRNSVNIPDEELETVTLINNLVHENFED